MTDFPTTIPIFPLSGVILLPDGHLPLNVFEERYVNMIDDALTSDRLVGMVQPKMGSENDMYQIGCAGRISSFSETDDGRYLITLTGICRFSFQSELTTTRGYRRVVPNWSAFEQDLDATPDLTVDREMLGEYLREYLAENELAMDLSIVKYAPPASLLTALAMGCPFSPEEKQGLLEAETLEERYQMLLMLLEMATHEMDYAITSRVH